MPDTTETENTYKTNFVELGNGLVMLIGGAVMFLVLLLTDHAIAYGRLELPTWLAYVASTMLIVGGWGSVIDARELVLPDESEPEQQSV